MIIYSIGFLINQSKEYVIATISSFIEFFVENYFFNKRKFNIPMIIIGLLLVILGHVFRIGAEFTAKRNFSHIIVQRKDKEHNLVDTGLYRYNIYMLF